MDRREKPEWRYKEQAIQRAASAFRRALGTDPLSLVFVPIPPSKTRNDPLYDDRVTRMLRAIGPDGTVDVRELIIQTKSTDAVHSRQTRPTPPQIQDQYRIDEALTIPGTRVHRDCGRRPDDGGAFPGGERGADGTLSGCAHRRAVHRTESARRRLTPQGDAGQGPSIFGARQRTPACTGESCSLKTCNPVAPSAACIPTAWLRSSACSGSARKRSS